MNMRDIIKAVVRVAFTPCRPSSQLQQARQKLSESMRESEKRLAAQTQKLKTLGAHD